MTGTRPAEHFYENFPVRGPYDSTWEYAPSGGIKWFFHFFSFGILFRQTSGTKRGVRHSACESCRVVERVAYNGRVYVREGKKWYCELPNGTHMPARRHYSGLNDREPYYFN